MKPGSLPAAEYEAQQRERDAEIKAMARVTEWEKAMRRTFKGIMPTPVRRRFLEAALVRAEREQA